MSGAERNKDKCVFYPFIYLHLFDVHGIGGYFALVLMFFFCFFSWNIHQGCLRDYLKQKKNTGDVSGSPFDPLYLHQSELRVQQMHRRETFGLRACFRRRGETRPCPGSALQSVSVRTGHNGFS